MYTDLLSFLRNEGCFIEAEACPSRMNSFLDEYNAKYGEHLSDPHDGLIVLQQDADKWGLELRLYVRNCPPPDVKSLGFKHNRAYRNEFSYRLNDNDIIKFLFDQGYRIGLN